MKPGHCRSCHAPVYWVTTEKGKDMPLDRDPVPDGNIVISPKGLAVYRKKSDVPQLPGIEEPPRYKSHFATCPDRDSWRKPKEK